ncbi:MAG: TonB-dependent receptor [Pseudomonadota bacterium]
MTSLCIHALALPRAHVTNLLASTAMATALLAAQTLPGMAQEQAQDTVSSDDVFLGTIVLSGTKRAETLDDFMGSVSVVTTDDLQTRNITDGVEAAQKTPGVNLYSYGDRTNAFVNIRGVGPILQPLSPDDSSVLTFVDGAALMLSQSGSAYLDVEQVEIFKGPQNTLFGRATSGGAINVVPNRPTDELEGSVRLEFGTDHEFLTEFIGNAPIVPGQLNARIALRRQGVDGYITNDEGPDFGEEDITAGRLSFEYTPSDATSVLLTYFAEEVDLVPSYYLPQLGDDDPQDGAQSFASDNQSSRIAALKIEHDFERFRFTSQTSFNKQDIENAYQGDHNLFSLIYGLPPSFFSAKETNRIAYEKEQTRVEQEFRLSSLPGDRISWVAGLSAYRDEFDIYNDSHNAVFQGAQSGIYTFDQTNEAVSVFADARIPLTDRLALSGGLRYTSETKEFDAEYDSTGFDAIYPGVVPSYSEKGKETYDFWTGKLALSYDWTPEVSTYVSVARGYKTGGFGVYSSLMAYGIPRDTYEPSETTSYEIGGRASLMGGALNLSGTIFYTDLNSEQIMLFDFANFQTRNANVDAFSRGIELEADWLVNDNWQLSAGVAYTQSEITGLPDDAATLNPGLEEGDELPNTPRLAVNLGVGYQATASELGWTSDWAPERVSARLGYNFQGERYFDAANEGKLEDTHLVSARLGFDWGNSELYVFGENLLDEDYFITRQPFGVAAGTNTPAYGVTEGRGRTIGVGYSMKF